MLITDCHVHIENLGHFKPSALELFAKHRSQFDEILRFMKSPADFLRYMDTAGVDRAVLINYVAPEVIGLTHEVNQWVADYCKADPKRLIPCGGLHPKFSSNILADVENVLRLGIKLIKIHPPHQLFYPNDYLDKMPALEIIYRAAEANGIPIMFHTGTSVFQGARNKFGDPIHIDDVAVDFPKLTIIMAHGGRPLWMDTAFFLIRRHPNVYMDISGVPPRHLMQYFPRLEEMAPKVLFGTDWPGPGVPDMGGNLEQVKALPISEAAKRVILSENALKMWPQ
jgi:uncharacterized protein